MIERLIFGVVDEESLIVGVQLDSAQSQLLDALQFLHGIGTVGKNRAEGDDIGGANRSGEVVDVLLLMGIGGDVEHD